MPLVPQAPLRHVLIVDDDLALGRTLTVALAREGFEAVAVSSREEALAELERLPFDVVVAGVELVEELRQLSLHPQGIVLAALGSPSSAALASAGPLSATVEAARVAIARGAEDFIARPVRTDDVVLALCKAEARARGWRIGVPEAAPVAHTLAATSRLARGAGRGDDSGGLIIATSAPMLEVLRVVRKIAEYKTTVLVTGESGTGKEMIARCLHAWSPRAEQPFVPVNCAAIPDALLESELFGHKKGAFTDAHRDKLGLFEEATGGTLFLDEIGDLPLALQVKLLRVLQEQEMRPLGATSDVKVDVRVIAATMHDLHKDVAEGRFREDLYYRLNVLPVHLPPLRERREEIPVLVEQFIVKTNLKLGTRITGCSAEAMRLLLEHQWPGNVRELENTVERAMVLAEGDLIEEGALPDKVRAAHDKVRMTLLGSDLSIKKATRVIEEELIRRALKETRGNRTNASKILEISHRALLYKIKEYGIADL